MPVCHQEYVIAVIANSSNIYIFNTGSMDTCCSSCHSKLELHNRFPCPYWAHHVCHISDVLCNGVSCHSGVSCQVRLVRECRQKGWFLKLSIWNCGSASTELWAARCLQQRVRQRSLFLPHRPHRPHQVLQLGSIKIYFFPWLKRSL